MHRRKALGLALLVVALIALRVLARDRLRLMASAFPSEAVPARRMAHDQQMAWRWMQEYLRIDTSNPPGNEQRAAEWFKRILDAK